MENITRIDSTVIQQEKLGFMSNVYGWMTFGLCLTALASAATLGSPQLLQIVFGTRFVLMGLMIFELALVWYLSARINKLSPVMAKSIFCFYSLLSGVTLSVVALAYTRSSIESAFFLTAFSFGGLSLFGFATKKDLGPIGSFCTMGLFGLIGFGLISMFFPSLMTETSSKIFSMVGVLVFAGLTAYDTQVIKSMRNQITSENQANQFVILGALRLYLDFINLFLMILRLVGGGRRK